jgi:hypothetical protein
VTSQGHPGATFWRTISKGNVIVAETVAREIRPLPLDFAIALIRLYGEKGDQRYEAAALRYLERYISQEKPSLLRGS